jgi:hypothetical protein
MLRTSMEAKRRTVLNAALSTSDVVTAEMSASTTATKCKCDGCQTQWEFNVENYEVVEMKCLEPDAPLRKKPSQDR